MMRITEELLPTLLLVSVVVGLVLPALGEKRVNNDEKNNSAFFCANPANRSVHVYCPPFTTCCASSTMSIVNEPTLSPQCCGLDFPKCCVGRANADRPSNTNTSPRGASTTSCLKEGYECPDDCPAHVKQQDASCPQYCELITNKALCLDRSWNSSCSWCGDGDRGGICQNVRKPMCSNSSERCCPVKKAGGSTEIECCDESARCQAGGVGCVPDPPICSKYDGNPKGCARVSSNNPKHDNDAKKMGWHQHSNVQVSSCYFCQGTRKCINTMYQSCEVVNKHGCDVARHRVCAEDGSFCCGEDPRTSVCCGPQSSICCWNARNASQYCCPNHYTCNDVGGCMYVG